MRLLIVDDNAALAENLKELFTDEGYDAVAVGTAKEALKEAKRGFDLAVVDVRLPDMPGTTLLPRLRALQPGSESVVVTANADLDSAIEAMKGGAFSYLTKPVRTEELILTVQRARDRIELQRRSAALKQALEVSERTLRKVMDTVSAVIIALDEEGRVRFVNRGAMDILGYEPEELIGHVLASLVSDAGEREAFTASLPSRRAKETSDAEVTMRHRSGGARVIKWRWSTVSDEEYSRFGVGTDITHETELERKIRAAERLAAAGTLTAGLAHEIRNPLNAAILQLSLLERLMRRLEPEPRSQLVEPLDLVQSELRRLDTLLENFLAFARPKDYARRVVDLSSLVERIVSFERAVVTNQGKKLEASIRANARVNGDEDALRQVVLNLLKNAIEASEHEVWVRVLPSADRVELEIEDDGPGISPENETRLFEPFFTTKSQGTGLGLPIVFTIVERHEGSIRFERRPAGGTRVMVTLPIAREP